MIAKFVNGRQDNWDVYLPAILYVYQTSPHKSKKHTLYKEMMGQARMGQPERLSLWMSGLRDSAWLRRVS